MRNSKIEQVFHKPSAQSDSLTTAVLTTGVLDVYTISGETNSRSQTLMRG
ncbi:MAG TPA: hypothetical protein VND42_02950 [Candidatus Acidoferrales bacterium]|nr:hypothetical protein [Candidatus Acidoferrales bacterium]